MRSPKDFIVKPVKGRRYDNTKNIGGKDILVSTSEEDYKFSNRLAIVQEVPLGYTGPEKKVTPYLFIIMFLNFIMTCEVGNKVVKVFLRMICFL